VDWRTSKLNHLNWQMPCKSSTLNSIVGLAIIVGFMILSISSEYYTTGTISNEYGSI
jgi:nitric oxide reductase large subunit